MKVLFPKVTSLVFFPIPEVTLSKDDPLSVDLTMFPEEPTATKVLFPNPTPLSSFEVGEVTVRKDDPLSVDLTMVPEIPTATNDALESEEVVVVAVDSEDAEDLISS